MDALKFEYRDYPKISEEAAGGVKRKITVSVMKKEGYKNRKGKKEKLTKNRRPKKLTKGSLHIREQNPLLRKSEEWKNLLVLARNLQSWRRKILSSFSLGAIEILKLMTQPLPFPTLSLKNQQKDRPKIRHKETVR